MAVPSSASPPAFAKPLGFLRRHRLGCGVALILAAALADAAMTLRGMGTDLALEGNPFARGLMEQLGPELGLAVQKVAIIGSTILIAAIGERAIRNQEPWIWRIPTTRWVRAWMRKRDRSWIAFIPLYGAIVAQAFAAASWVALTVVR